MKALLLFSLALGFLAAQATQVTHKELKNCRYYNGFIHTGWVVHDPATFDTFNKQIVSAVKSGVDSGEIHFDMSGPILTNETINGQELLLDAISWDAKTTPQMTMFGDYAFIENATNHEMVELRWYDGNKRNVVINPKFLRCMSESAPYVENSVL